MALLAAARDAKRKKQRAASWAIKKTEQKVYKRRCNQMLCFLARVVTPLLSDPRATTHLIWNAVNTATCTRAYVVTTRFPYSDMFCFCHCLDHAKEATIFLIFFLEEDFYS